MARILVIDDDELIRNSLTRLVAELGHEVATAANLTEGQRFAEQGVDLIFLDLNLPDGDGLQAVDRLAATQSRPEIIVITGVGSRYGAKRTLESGAWEYITKPASPETVRKAMLEALRYRRRSQDASACPEGRTSHGAVFDDCGILGWDESMRRIREDIQRAAAGDAGVLISGDTGVGKELTARAIHANSHRKKRPFVVVDCSSLTGSLIESVLYGHAKGSFTGAHTDREGLVAQADGGVLFLDEVGELPLSQQRSFLRVLQERRFRPVGGAREHFSDFRILAATNRDLDAMVREGSFRSDLLFRIRTMAITLPPLRERGDDVLHLAAHFIDQVCERYGQVPKRPSRELERVIADYAWPGNVRELANVMEAAVMGAGQDAIMYPKHLPGNVRLNFLNQQEERKESAARPLGHWQIPAATQAGAEQPRDEAPGRRIPTYAEHKAERDREYFARLLEMADYTMVEASRLSGLSVPSVYRHVAKAGLPTRRPRGAEEA